MEIINLIRYATSDFGTRGVLIGSNIFFECLELPWRDNTRNFSCIPDGQYECELVNSKKFGRVYWVKDVSNRSLIRIHCANLAGDSRKGYISQLSGCIAPGIAKGTWKGQSAVFNSRTACRRFKESLNKKPFTLNIVWRT